MIFYLKMQSSVAKVMIVVIAKNIVCFIIIFDLMSNWYDELLSFSLTLPGNEIFPLLNHHKLNLTLIFIFLIYKSVVLDSHFWCWIFLLKYSSFQFFSLQQTAEQHINMHIMWQRDVINWTIRWQDTTTKKYINIITITIFNYN